MAKSARKTKEVVETVEIVEMVAAPEKVQREKLVLNDAQQAVYSEMKTTSAKIRYLHGEGFTKGQIAEFLNKKYQHVRNVILTPLKRPAKSVEAVEISEDME